MLGAKRAQNHFLYKFKINVAAPHVNIQLPRCCKAKGPMSRFYRVVPPRWGLVCSVLLSDFIYTPITINQFHPKLCNFPWNWFKQVLFISFQINSTVVTIDSSVSPVHGFEYDRAGIFTFQQNLAALIGFTLPLWTGNPGYNTQFDGDQGW